MATTPKPKKASTAYSPKPMSAFAKEKAAMRGAKTAEKIKNPMGLKQLPREGSRKPKAGSSTASKVVKRAKTVAREAGDVKKAVKNVAKSGAAALNPSYSGIRNLGKEAVKATGKDLKKQLKEVGSALVSGKPGSRTRNISYNPDTGTPQGVKTVRPKYGANPGKSYKTGTKK